MTLAVMIFILAATAVAIATLAFVTVDLIVEWRKKGRDAVKKTKKKQHRKG